MDSRSPFPSPFNDGVKKSPKPLGSPYIKISVVFCTKLPKAQHRGHKESQRATEKKLAVSHSVLYPLAITARPSVLSVGFFRVSLCLNSEKRDQQYVAPMQTFRRNSLAQY